MTVSGDANDIEWWLDEAALPERIWAALIAIGDGPCHIIDADLAHHEFERRRCAVDWLRADEYEPYSELLRSGAVNIIGPMPACPMIARAVEVLKRSAQA